MRQKKNYWLWLWTPVLSLAGCVPQLGLPGDNAVDTVAGWSNNDGSNLPAVSVTSGFDDSEPATITGSVSGTGNYQIFDLGSAAFGDEWAVSLESSLSTASAYTVVLFDADYDLLMRERVSSRCVLEHITRLDTPHVYLGVMPAYGSRGGDFGFELSMGNGAVVPPPRQQVVYVDFQEGYDVRVHTRSPISFPAFDAAMLGPSYVDHTQVIKDTILATMHEDYAPYNVVILSSDDGPPPSDVPYSTVHIGGDDSRLLGLADNVDMYNQELGQTAMVYVESFAAYEVMRLEPDEMGVMIGNVASHELGHLLGLYHTKVPQEIMDCTGSAWDLAGEQSCMRAPLEDTVFATGMENTPRLLEQTVGLRPGPAEASKLLSTAKRVRYKQIRDFTKGELRCRCGLCINPDE